MLTLASAQCETSTFVSEITEGQDPWQEEHGTSRNSTSYMQERFETDICLYLLEIRRQLLYAQVTSTEDFRLIDLRNE